MMGAQCEYDQDMPPIIRSAVLLEGNFEAGSPADTEPRLPEALNLTISL